MTSFTHRPIRILLLAVAALAVAACSLVTAPLGEPAAGLTEAVGLPYPEGCAAFELTARQCDHIVNRLGNELHVDRSTVRDIRLLGDPGCDGVAEDGTKVLCMSTMALVVRVRFIQDDGHVLESAQYCGVGAEYDLGCTDPPTIRLSAPTLSGYQDVPCAGEPPDGCASAVPTIDPAVAPKRRPLEIASLDVPLDHVGHFDIPLGNAVLPNGVLTEGSFALADDAQRDFLLVDGVVSLVVSGPDGKPVWNVYEQGWRAGTETVDAHLVFDVESLDPGAVLHVRDVAVN
jgi:hypothetical protein